MEKLFEVASRKAYRFPFKGMITTEDLWKLSSKNLDEVFKTLNSQKKVTEEESLMQTASDEDVDLLNKIAIVKYIYKNNEQQAVDRLMEREKRQKDQRIMEIIARKQNEALEGKSIEELQAMLGA